MKRALALNIKYILKLSILIVVLCSWALLGPAWGQSNEDCEACHSDPGLTAVR